MAAGNGAGEAFGAGEFWRVMGLNRAMRMVLRRGARRGRRRVELDFHTDVETGWCSRWGVSGRAGGRCASGMRRRARRQWAEVLGVVAAAIGTGDAGGVVGRGSDAGAVWVAHFQGGLGLLEQECASGIFALGALSGMPESVVADFMEAFGQHVLEEAADELVSGEGAGAPLPVLAVFVAEGGFPIDEQCEPVLERQAITLGHLGLFLERFGHAEQAQFVEFINRGLVQHDSPPFPGYR